MQCVMHMHHDSWLFAKLYTCSFIYLMSLLCHCWCRLAVYGLIYFFEFELQENNYVQCKENHVATGSYM